MTGPWSLTDRVWYCRATTLEDRKVTSTPTHSQETHMGAGGIINQRAAIKTAVNDPAIYGALPQHCRDRINDISAKGLPDWTDDETSFMASMIHLAVHC